MKYAGARRVVWLIVRARYAALTILAPSLIALGAWWRPQLLHGLLLLDLGGGRLAWLTWISAMVVALGLAIFRVIQLHGAARMGNSAAPSWSNEISLGKWRLIWDDESIGWPLVPTVVWLIASVLYPVVALGATVAEIRAEAGGEASADAAAARALWSGGIDIAWGILLAAASMFLLALLRTAIVGGKSAGSGLLLGEGAAHWIISRFRDDLVVHRQPILKFPIHLDGVTDPASKRLLPGHPQLLVAMMVSVTVYLAWHYWTMTDDAWVQPDWPVGFYLLLLTYCSSAVFCFLAFILDRYHLPATIALAIYVALFADAHRYYELAPPSSQGMTASRAADGEARDHVLLAALSERPSGSQPRPYLEDLYGLDPQRHFVFPKWADGKRTMVVVTASGGGIQAAAWTSQVLTGLDERSPRISESIGLISAVSGGSVGVMHYLAQRRSRGNTGVAPESPLLTEEQRTRVNRNAQASSLEAIGWGMAFPDFARTVSPVRLNRLIDRGWALEASWWGRLGPAPSAPRFASQMKEVRIRDLVAPVRAGHLPPVIFNATAVETGQRVMISPVHTEATRAGDAVDYRNVHSPIDFIDFYEAAVTDPQRINPRLTTAVRLSATFAYVTPVARPLPLPAEQIKPKYRSRFDMHLCDGGYADNTGLVTAIRLVHDLVVHYQTRMSADPTFEPPFDRVIFLRIEPFPESAVEIVADSSGLKAALLGPATALAATRTSTQAERADLELALLMDLTSTDLAASQDELSLLEIRRREFADAVAAMGVTGEENSRIRAAASAFWALAQKGAASPSSRRELQRRLSRVEREANLLANSRSDAVLAAAKALSELPAFSRRPRIEVKTVLIRFGARLGGSLDGEADDTMSATMRHPPLSWLLAQSDINALTESWRHYEAAFNGASVAIASGPKQPWTSTNQQLSAGTLHPHVFGKLAGAKTTKATKATR